jgi:hypothetical protein
VGSSHLQIVSRSDTQHTNAIRSTASSPALSRWSLPSGEMARRMPSRRRWAKVSVVAAVAVLIASCSSAPSTAQVETAVSRLLAAPTPEGALDATDSWVSAGDGEERVEATNVFRTELCSDGSCPMLTRFFTPLRPESLDASCALLDDYVRSVGGRQMDKCPPEWVARASGNSGPGSTEDRQDTGVVKVDGEWGNVVMYRLDYSVAAEGVWVEGSDVELFLGIGRRFCSDSAIGVPCEG